MALTFPERNARGVAFTLAKESNPSKVLYILTSDWGYGPPHTPTWAAAGEEEPWPDVGLSGPGPDHVVVPDTAEDGTYLLCTANAVTGVCGQLTVQR